MTDDIIIKRTWQDVNFFQIEITCQTKHICVREKVYTTNELIDDLYNMVEQFLSGNVATCNWVNGEKGNSTTPSISFAFSHKDKQGHIQVEVYIEIDDGGSLNAHHCCFYINTEIGLLGQFKENLLRIKTPQIGVRISLKDGSLS